MSSERRSTSTAAVKRAKKPAGETGESCRHVLKNGKYCSTKPAEGLKYCWRAAHQPHTESGSESGAETKAEQVKKKKEEKKTGKVPTSGYAILASLQEQLDDLLYMEDLEWLPTTRRAIREWLYVLEANELDYKYLSHLKDLVKRKDEYGLTSLLVSNWSTQLRKNKKEVDKYVTKKERLFVTNSLRSLMNGVKATKYKKTAEKLHELADNDAKLSPKEINNLEQILYDMRYNELASSLGNHILNSAKKSGH